MDTPARLSAPPRAEQRPYSYERHGVTIEDPWHWLRDPKYPEVDDPDVLAYLKAENAYFEGWKAQHQGLIDQLFEEMKGRIKEDDSSVPIRDGDWLYWWAFKPGAQYRTWYRKPVGGRRGRDDASTSRPRPRASEYFRLGALEVSPDGKLLATLADYDGSERFELRIRDLATGKDIETVTKVGIGQPVWTSDSGGHRLHRGQRQLAQLSRALSPARHAGRRGRHALRGDRGARLLASASASRTTGALIFISTGDNATSEVRFVSADDPTQPLTLISPRKAEPRISCRRGARETVDPHQRRPCELPPRRAPIRPTPEEWRDGDRRLGPRLSDRRRPPIATISRSAAGSTASIS